MKNVNRFTAQSASARGFLAIVLVAVLGISGCENNGERDETDGTIINQVILPTDVVLGLYCADVGIYNETCVLEDPENPFANTPISEFDPNNPGAENKFELFNSIPAGPQGAKARFYFWATALARRQSGENQFYTALALHELFDANSNVLSKDELIREQALRAYQSVLDNFFSSATVFTCCPASSPDGEPVPFPVSLNQLTADNLYRPEATGFLPLVEGDRILVLSLLLDWGYNYLPATPPLFNDGVVSVIEL